MSSAGPAVATRDDVDAAGLDAFGLRLVDGLDGLAEIKEPGAAAIVWARRPLERLQRWVDALDPETMPRARMVLRPDAVADAVAQVCDAHGAPATPERALLIDDVAALSQTFAEIMRAPFLRVRLDVVQGDACRRFHIDAVTARLICTYRGPGTQFAVAPDGWNAERIYTTPSGCPALMRGTRWLGEPSGDLRHRSPPINGTGQARLVLVLDPVHDPDDEGA